MQIKDHATAPLKKLKDSLFSIKTLIAGVVAGAATKTAILNPIGLADAYSGAKIGFSNILGGEAQGQEMMDKLDAFAKETPFNTTNVIGNAQKMLAMGWDVKDADSFIDDMRVLGNAAASTGKMDQGLESIVRAMSQIKTKGKLSTEELNQLAEAGIAAKAMLAEELGYGTGDAGIAAMTKELESGAIGSQKAIDALMRGMSKYDGMMESMANETAEGLASQLKDTFEISIFRKWGQGLQEGAKKGLGSVLQLLDKSEDKLAKVGDVLFELGSSLSTKAAEGLDKVIQKILTVTESEEFANASAGGKAKMLWEEVIAKPLGDWWESSGREKVVNLATEIGTTLGKGIWEGFKLLMKENPLLGTLVGAHAVSSLMAPFGGVLGGMSKFGKTAIGARLIGSTGTAMVAGSGINGLLASAGYALTGGAAGSALAGGTAALIGGGSVLGGLAGLLGIGSGIKDIYHGAQSTGKDRKTKLLAGGTKLGLVGAGAAAGTAIMPGAGTLIGAGIGGIGAMLAGGKIGEALSDLTDKMGEFFTETLPEKWGELWDGVGNFFTETVPTAWNTVKESISVFFTETLPEKWDEMWDGIGGFFTETLPYAIGYAAGATVRFFTETLPEKWDEFWDSVSAFFTETVPTWAENTWSGHIVPFFTETIPAKWDELWTAISTLFTETIPAWAENVWTSKINPFFTVTVPGFFSSLWDSVSSFVTEGIPSIASTIWSNVSSFFTDTVPGWFNSVWENLKSGFSAGSGGSGKKASKKNNAAGGIIGGRTLSWLGEEGPEAVIPLGSKHKSRAIGLWQQAGQSLGMGGGGGVQVDVGGVHIHISGSGNVAGDIESQKEEIAEQIAAIFNRVLKAQFENTPAKAGA